MRLRLGFQRPWPGDGRVGFVLPNSVVSSEVPHTSPKLGSFCHKTPQDSANGDEY